MLNFYKLIPISRFVIEGHSMKPTLKVGQSVISFNWNYFFFKPKENDIVVAQVNNRLIIKRIKRINLSQIWLEGDNLIESSDSRIFGWINKSHIIGKIITSLP